MELERILSQDAIGPDFPWEQTNTTENMTIFAAIFFFFVTEFSELFMENSIKRFDRRGTKTLIALF